jgi:hypothetical protein
MLTKARELEQKEKTRLLTLFCEEFRRAYQLHIRFTPEASELLLMKAHDADKPLLEFCREWLHELPYGLRLIANNTGKLEFEIDGKAIDEPSRFLSEWVVASCRPQK